MTALEECTRTAGANTDFSRHQRNCQPALAEQLADGESETDSHIIWMPLFAS